MARLTFARTNAPFARIVRKNGNAFARTAAANWCADHGGRSGNSGFDEGESAGHRTLRIFAWLFAVTYLPLIPILNFALSCICFLRQLSQVGKEGWRLAD